MNELRPCDSPGRATPTGPGHLDQFNWASSIGRVRWAVRQPPVGRGNDGLQLRPRTEFAQEAAYVAAYRGIADVQPLGDLPVVHSLGHQAQDLPFPGGEAVQPAGAFSLPL